VVNTTKETIREDRLVISSSKKGGKSTLNCWIWRSVQLLLLPLVHQRRVTLILVWRKIGKKTPPRRRRTRHVRSRETRVKEGIQDVKCETPSSHEIYRGMSYLWLLALTR